MKMSKNLGILQYCIIRLQLNSQQKFYITVDFTIQVLSSGSWPFQQSCAFSLPQEVRIFIMLRIPCNVLGFLQLKKMPIFRGIIVRISLFFLLIETAGTCTKASSNMYP